MEAPAAVTPAAPHSLFLQWPKLFSEGERLLDDLAALTGIDSIELSGFCLEWGPRSGPHSPREASLPLPRDADFDGLQVLAADDGLFHSVLDVIQLIRSRGFRVVCNLTPLYIGSSALAGLGMTDVTGARVRGHHPKLLVDACPSNPDTVAYATATAREFIRWWPLDAITINHVEHSLWPENGPAQLFSCFCDACRTRAREQQIPFGRLEGEARDAYEALVRRDHGLELGSVTAADVLQALIRRPYLAQWLHFRLESMTDLVEATIRSLRDSARRFGRQVSVGLESQLPTLAKLVGTDWERLAPQVDWLISKFPDYVAGSAIPVIADELAGDAPGAGVALRQALRQFLDFGPGPERYRTADCPEEGLVYSNAFDATDIRKQLGYLERASLPVATVPYLWLHNDDAAQLAQRIRLCREHGLDGYFLWCWERNLTTEALRASSGMF